MRIEIPPGDFAGYIFDLDGTLIDSMPLHYQAWNICMQRHGMKGQLDEDLFYSLGGVPTPKVAAILGAHYGLKLDFDKFTQIKEAMFLKLLPGVPLIQPVVDFVRRVARKRPVSIATGGQLDVAVHSIAASGLSMFFKHVVTPADVPEGRGKPAPDMFLLAARRMGVAPQSCLVFEDAEPGIQGALAAGMKVVRVPSRQFIKTSDQSQVLVSNRSRSGLSFAAGSS